MPRTKNAFLNRIHVRAWLAAALVGGVPLISHAGYAQLAPPPGFSSGSGGFSYATSANDQVFGRVIHQPNGLTANVGGQAVKMSASYRLAANAPRIAAAAIFANPYVRVGVGIATWLGVGKVVWDAVDGVWREQREYVDGVEYGTYYQGATHWFKTPDAACNAWKSGMGITVGSATVTESTCSVNYTNPQGVVYPQGSTSINKRTGNGYCPGGTVQTPAGCMTPALTQQQMVDLLNPANQPGWPMSPTLPSELPPNTPLPVERPVINPAPGETPLPRPLFVPTGNPVPNPNYDPNAAPSPTNQPYFQPGVRVVPSPTDAEPWRVDYQPVDRPVTSSDPMPEPSPEDDPNASPGDKPKEEQPDLCKTNPDILACAKPDLDTPEGEIPKSNKDVSLQEENLFGGGSCPADLYFTPHGLQQLKVWDWNNACGYITGYVKPILIICCTFAAFMILVPGRTE